jgi:hypothetical protein
MQQSRVTKHKDGEAEDGLHAWSAIKPHPSAEEQHREFLERATRGRSKLWTH